MPWEHCDRPILDDSPCPACGTTKEVWSCQWDATRVFQVQARASASCLRFALKDEAAPARGEPYRVVLPDGRAVEGVLDDFGAAKVPCGPGRCTVTFPARAASCVRALGSPAEVAGQPGDLASFQCAVGPRVDFELVPLGVVHARLFARSGDAPLGRVAYTLWTDGAGVLGGETDDEGVARRADVPLGFHVVEARGMQGVVAAVPAWQADAPSAVWLAWPPASPEDLA